MKFKRILSSVISVVMLLTCMIYLPAVFAANPNGIPIEFGFKPMSSTDSNAIISGNTITIPSDDVAQNDIIVTIGGFFDTYTSSDYDFGGFDMQFKASNDNFIFINEWKNDKEKAGMMSSLKGPATKQASTTYTLADGTRFTTTFFPTCFGKVKTTEDGITEYLTPTNNYSFFISNNIGTDNVAKVIM